MGGRAGGGANGGMGIGSRSGRFQVEVRGAVSEADVKRITDAAKEILSEEKNINLEKLIITDEALNHNGKEVYGLATPGEKRVILRAGSDYREVAHELGHLIPAKEKLDYDKQIRDFKRMNKGHLNEKGPKGVLERLEKRKAAYNSEYNRNKTLNDQMNQLYKEFKGKGRSMAFSDYAWRGGFREFAADAFAHAKALQKAYKEGRVKGGGSFETSNSLPVRVYRVMKGYK